MDSIGGSSSCVIYPRRRSADRIQTEIRLIWQAYDVMQPESVPAAERAWDSEMLAECHIDGFLAH